MPRLLKPKTVMEKWDKLVAGSKRAPGRRQAKEYAAMAGMRSIGEVRCAADMDARGIKYIYEPFKIEYHLCENWSPDCKVKTQKYTPDFYLPDYDLIIEYKGKMTSATRKQFLAVKRVLGHERRLCIVFEKPRNKLSSRPNSSRYWEWAEKSGLGWSDQVVDPGWLQ